MSGFAGIVRTSRVALEEQDSTDIETVAARLVFRGPDGTNIWRQGNVSFCFTFLRTGPAAQAETQPLSLDGLTWFLGEARLDGREEVIRWLNGRDESCRAEAPDEELILRAWRCSKPADRDGLFQEILIGDYSFVLWDSAQSQLHCVRSLIGSRPFFYSRRESGFFFSNTLRALNAVPEISGDLDPEFLGDLLLHGWCTSAERSVYRDIRRLVPGHVLTFSKEGVRLRRVAKLPIEEPLRLTRSEEYVEEYLALVARAVRDRLPTEPTAVFMSGGLDSTTVAAVALDVLESRGARRGLEAICVGYRTLFDDPEPAAASTVAQYLGIPMDVLEASNFAPFLGWDNAEFVIPEPLTDPFHALVIRQFQLVGAKARVVLSGDGGDDVLLGPAWPYVKYLLSRRKMGALLGAFGGYFLKHGRIPPLRAGILWRMRTLMGTQDDPKYPEWLNPDFERSAQLRARWQELKAKPEEEHPLHPRAYFALNAPSWPQMREYDDCAWTGSLVETRAPLLDVRLLKFELRLPPVPWCIDKEIVRRAMVGKLPELIRRRPKAPLAQEPLDMFVTKSQWKPSPACVSRRIHEFVNWKKWQATPLRKTGSNLLTAVRPIALDLWLKSIEMNGQIE